MNWFFAKFVKLHLGCGIKKTGTKIVGGQGANVNEYPWMIWILFFSELSFD